MVESLRNRETNAYVEAAEEAGVKLVREMMVGRELLADIVPGKISEQQREQMINLAETAREFYEVFYPGYLGKDDPLTAKINFCAESGAGEMPSYSNFGEGAASWQKAWLKDQAEIGLRLIKKIGEDLNISEQVFYLDPEADKGDILAALWLAESDESMLRSLFNEGVIVNDMGDTLKAALGLGFNFIYVDSMRNIERVGDLV